MKTRKTIGAVLAIAGLFITVCVALIIIGGIKRIATVSEVVVPVMIVLYVGSCLLIILGHITEIPAAIVTIVQGAFGLRQIAGGAAGTAVLLAMRSGIARGIFSNEAGLGSSVMVHSNSNVKEPVKQGMWGIFEVFADTIVVCTLTAFSVLSSGLVNLATGETVAEYAGVTLNKANLVSTVFSIRFGWIGSAFIAISIALFAFSTVLGWSHYGTKAAEYLLGEKNTIPYRIIFVLLVFGGAVMGDNLAWDLADTFNGMMMIPNLIGVIALSGVVAVIEDLGHGVRAVRVQAAHVDDPASVGIQSVGREDRSGTSSREPAACLLWTTRSGIGAISGTWCAMCWTLRIRI